MKRSILIIDDDVALTSLLDEYLQGEGYQIHVVNHGEQGLHTALHEQSFDLILLDVMLPGLDGFEVLKQLRQAQNLTPVLMLTAKGDDFDRIFGLELGADDYLPKPFNHRELSARIKALLRRADYHQLSQVSPTIEQGNLQISLSNRSVTCDGHYLALTGTEFSLLQLFIERLGNLITKQDISEIVLGRKLAPFDRSIDMHVSNLRKKLTQANATSQIKTVRGTGYLLTLGLDDDK